MKQLIPIFWLTLLILLPVGCGGPKHVSGAEFEREYELRDTQTLFWAEYLGEKDGKVLLRRKSAPLVGDEWNEEIWYTRIDELDPQFLQELRAD